MATKPQQVISPTHPPKVTSIKSLAESKITSIPSTFTVTNNINDQTIVDELEETLPVIDFSQLTSDNPDLRSKAIDDLGKACEEWGFFMVVNHGVSEKLMKGVIEACKGFFDLSEEEKRQFDGKDVMDPIKCGTSVNSSIENVLFWRDYLKTHVHPEFHFPNKPPGFSEIAFEYCKQTREVTRELVKGISESLGLETSYIDKAMNLDSGSQYITINLYPPCPQPDLALGLPPHSDTGLVNLVIHNGYGGFQLERNGKWVNVESIPNSFLANTADHLEILSNGKYKSVVHRAVVNNKATRISIAVENGPSLDTFVAPAPELVDQSHPPAYIGMTYRDYLNVQRNNKLNRKSCLDRFRI